MQLKESQAKWLGYCFSSSQRAKPSLIDGIVSKANKSTPASTNASTLGLCHSINSYLKKFIKKIKIKFDSLNYSTSIVISFA